MAHWGQLGQAGSADGWTPGMPPSWSTGRQPPTQAGLADGMASGQELASGHESAQWADMLAGLYDGGGSYGAGRGDAHLPMAVPGLNSAQAPFGYPGISDPFGADGHAWGSQAPPSGSLGYNSQPEERIGGYSTSTSGSTIYLDASTSRPPSSAPPALYRPNYQEAGAHSHVATPAYTGQPVLSYSQPQTMPQSVARPTQEQYSGSQPSAQQHRQHPAPSQAQPQPQPQHLYRHQHVHVHQHHFVPPSHPFMPAAAQPSLPGSGLSGKGLPMQLDTFEPPLSTHDIKPHNVPPPKVEEIKPSPLPSAPSSLTSIASEPQPPAPKLPSDLPLAVTLTHIATAHLHVARSMVPLLLKRPSSKGKGKAVAGTLDTSEKDTAAKAEAIATYRRHIYAAIIALRAIISTANSSDPRNLNLISPPEELLARCMLAEVLLRELLPPDLGSSGTEDAARGASAAESVIIKGLQKVQERGEGRGSEKEGWTEWRWRLSALSIEATLQRAQKAGAAGERAKYAKMTIKRFIKDLQKDPKAIVWLYYFHLLLSHIALSIDSDPASSLLPLSDAIDLSKSRGDEGLYIALKLREAKILMEGNERGALPRVAIILEELAGMVDGIDKLAAPPPAPDHTPTKPASTPWRAVPEAKVDVPRPLKAQLLLLLCLHSAVAGEVKAAKEWLKQLHKIMDDPKGEEGEEEGVVRVPIQPPKDPRSRPRSSLPPPQIPMHPGSSPVASFGRVFSQFSIDSPQSASHRSPSATTSTADESERSESAPHLTVDVETMPRGLMYTLTFLVSAVIHPDAHGKKPKATLFATEGIHQIDDKLLGNNAHGFAKMSPLALAAESLETMQVIKIELVFVSAQLAIMRSEFAEAKRLVDSLIALVREIGRWEFYQPRIMAIQGMLSHATGSLDYAASCFLGSLHLCRSSTPRTHSLQEDLLALSRASYILVRVAQGARLKTRESGSAVGKGSVKRKRDGDSRDAREEDLEEMVKDLNVGAAEALPTHQTAMQIVEALTCGEIVRAKQHLSGALTNANQLVNSHMKALLLAFLASLFANTRNEQALKMMQSSFKLATGFGSGEGEGYRAYVGHASLGLWAGERLHQAYLGEEDDKASKQLKQNAAHRAVLAAIQPIPGLGTT